MKLESARKRKNLVNFDDKVFLVFIYEGFTQWFISTHHAVVLRHRKKSKCEKIVCVYVKWKFQNDALIPLYYIIRIFDFFGENEQKPQCTSVHSLFLEVLVHNSFSPYPCCSISFPNNTRVMRSFYVFNDNFILSNCNDGILKVFIFKKRIFIQKVR